MKLLIVTPLYPPDIGGPATYSKLLEEELPKQGIEVELLKFSDVRHLPKGLSHLVFFVRVFRAINTKDPLYILDPSPAMFAAALAAYFKGKSYMLKIVGDIAWEQGQQRFGVRELLDEFVKKPTSSLPFVVQVLRFIQLFTARNATSIIVPSTYLKGIVTAWGIPPEKITVVYNAFDPIQMSEHKEVLRKKLSLQGRVILSAGRLVPWKGFELLIELMPELRKKYPDVRLLIVGSGPTESTLKEKIATLDLKSTVTMLGQVEHARLMEYAAASDCFVLNTGYEGLSHQLLEVMASKTPIVATNIGGNPELIENGKTGLLVPYNHRDELFRAINRMFADVGLRENCSREAFRFVASFSRERMIKETIALFRAKLFHV